MERPLHVGLVGRGESTLLADLRALPGRPEVRSFGPLFEQTSALLAFEPDTVFVCASSDDRPDELAGGLLLLRGIRPACALVLVVDKVREVAWSPVCARIGAQLLCEPCTPAQLLAAFDHALSGGDRPRAEVFLDLVHGIADEINNPLMFLMGHLQLLQLQMPAEKSGEAMEQIAAALAGAQRVHETVERMRRIEKAAAGPRRSEPFDIAAEMGKQLLETRGKGEPLALVRDPADASFSIPGDAEILRPALAGFAALAHEFRDEGAESHVVVTRLEGSVRMRLSLRGHSITEWNLPRTYEPYYLSRVLRGSSQGLALFHLQAAAHGHRGRATARRLPDATVAVDVEFPSR